MVTFISAVIILVIVGYFVVSWLAGAGIMLSPLAFLLHAKRDRPYDDEE